MNLKVNAHHINHDDLTQFLNSNSFTELEIYGLKKELFLHDSLNRSIRSFKIDHNFKFIDLKKFTSL